GIETDAELPDQLRVRALIASQPLDEAVGAGMRNRSELLYDLIPAHADPAVENAQLVPGRIQRDFDAELARLLQQLWPRQPLESQLVARIRRVGYQLAEEDLPVAVKRMNHQVKQLLHFGLKAVRAWRRCFYHRRPPLAQRTLG